MLLDTISDISVIDVGFLYIIANYTYIVLVMLMNGRTFHSKMTKDPQDFIKANKPQVTALLECFHNFTVANYSNTTIIKTIEL